MNNYFTKKEQIVILVLALTIISVLGFKLLDRPDDEFEVEKAEILNFLNEEVEDIEKTSSLDEEISIIMIHISGEIYNPGLIELEHGCRLIDAVEMAGGLKKDADLDKINLAKRLNDEDKIYIPKIGEDFELQASEVISSESSRDQVGKININKCTKEELMTLPGVGEATAKKILEYRSNNPFRKEEDIMEVSGIGEKKYLSMKDLIIVK